MKIQKILPNENGKPIIFVDTREMASTVTNFLSDLDAEVRTVQLEIGDYILSDRVVCERKTVRDFLQSIINQRIFGQLEGIKKSYEKPVLIIEGNPEMLFLERDIHENTIRGVLSSIAIDYSIPILWTQNAKETAAQLFWIANREQVLGKREIQIRASKKSYPLKQQQEYLLAGLPFVSNTLSKRLLKHFKTPKKVFTASAEQLMKVEKIGRKKAEMIKKILNSKYNEND